MEQAGGVLNRGDGYMAIENGEISLSNVRGYASTATTRKTINFTPFRAVRYTIGSGTNGTASTQLLRKEGGEIKIYTLKLSISGTTDRTRTADVSKYTGHYFFEISLPGSGSSGVNISKIEFLT